MREFVQDAPILLGLYYLVLAVFFLYLNLPKRWETRAGRVGGFLFFGSLAIDCFFRFARIKLGYAHPPADLRQVTTTTLQLVGLPLWAIAVAPYIRGNKLL